MPQMILSLDTGLVARLGRTSTIAAFGVAVLAHLAGQRLPSEELRYPDPSREARAARSSPGSSAARPRARAVRSRDPRGRPRSPTSRARHRTQPRIISLPCLRRRPRERAGTGFSTAEQIGRHGDGVENLPIQPGLCTGSRTSALRASNGPDQSGYSITQAATACGSFAISPILKHRRHSRPPRTWRQASKRALAAPQADRIWATVTATLRSIACAGGYRVSHNPGAVTASNEGAVWPSSAPRTRATTSSVTSRSDQHDHARWGGGTFPYVAASRSRMSVTARQAVSASADRSCGPRNQARNSARSARSQRSR